MGFAERAARDQKIFREVNNRIEEGAEQHHVASALPPFIASAARASCVETIEIPPGRYEAIVQDRYHIVILLGHEDIRVERIVETEEGFVVVEKVGEPASR